MQKETACAEANEDYVGGLDWHVIVSRDQYSLTEKQRSTCNHAGRKQLARAQDSKPHRGASEPICDTIEASVWFDRHADMCFQYAGRSRR